MTPNRDEPIYITAAIQVVMKAIRETSVLVSTQAVGLIKRAPHEKVVKIYACMTATRIVGVYPGPPTYVKFSNVHKVDVHLPKHQKVVEVADVLV